MAPACTVISWYQTHYSYQHALVAGAWRIDLDGKHVTRVTEAEENAAKQYLIARKTEMATRNAADKVISVTPPKPTAASIIENHIPADTPQDETPCPNATNGALEPIPQPDPQNANALGTMTFGTSAVLPLTPGTWYYRVRGFDFSLRTGSQQMTWSDPAKIVVAKPKFKIVPGK